MINKEIESIIVKYLNNQASVDEMDQLDLWLKINDNERLFRSYVETNYAIAYEVKQFATNNVKCKLQELMVEEKRMIRRKKVRTILSYAAAAVIVGVMAIGYSLKINNANKPMKSSTEIANNKIKPGSNKAILTLGDGSQIALQKGSNYKIKNADSNGEEIIYRDRKTNSPKITYNFLTVPRGGQFHIVLSDGTEVWLNSESQLKYPVNFRKGQTREVELVYGEGYFNVSPSTAHDGSKFVVTNPSQKIEVLGTEFNLKAYKEDANIYTTLVEGKVSVKTATGHKTLKPSQQATLNIEDHSMAIAEVDVYHEISWRDGVFSFRKMPIEEIMKVLSRWYDMDVQFENSDLKNVRFNGVLGRDQNIEGILNTIKSFGVIKDYEINNKTILLK